MESRRKEFLQLRSALSCYEHHHRHCTIRRQPTPPPEARSLQRIMNDDIEVEVSRLYPNIEQEIDEGKNGEKNIEVTIQLGSFLFG